MEDYTHEISYWMIPLVIIMAIIYVFSPQIDFWWWNKYPVALDRSIITWLETYVPFYINLNKEDKSKFENRLSIFIHAKEFFVMGSVREEIPEDLKAILSFPAIVLTFHQPTFLFKDLDRIGIYKHAFPSPQHQFLHTVESHLEDGVLLYSLEHLLPGITRKSEFYPIGYHAMIDAFISIYKPAFSGKVYKGLDENQLANISQIPHQRVLDITGFKHLPLEIMTINYFFNYPQRFRTLSPELALELERYFKADY